MATRVCYLARRRRGDALRELRLVSGKTDKVWTPDDPARPQTELARQGASWVKSALGKKHSLGMLCVDVDGSVCTWLTAPGSERRVLDAAMRSGAGGWAEEHAASISVGDWAGDRASVQSAGELALDGEAGGKRLAVLAVPDALACVLIEAMDRVHLRPAGVLSLWHALALAWDPASPVGARITDDDEDDEHTTTREFVSADTPVVGIVVIDPDTEKLVWSWSRQGRLLAGGSVRLSRDAAGVAAGEGDVGRLVADWMSFSAQLGLSPTRAVCVVPDHLGGIGAHGVGSALGARLQGVAVDLATNEQPVIATLRRLARLRHADALDAGVSLVDLATRPVRAHRWMYRWSAAAMVAGAGVLGVGGYRLWTAADQTRGRADQIRSDWQASIADVMPAAAASPFPDDALRSEIKNLSARARAGEIGSDWSVLGELNAISLVLSSALDAGIEIETIEIGHTLGATISVKGSDTGSLEALPSALQDVSGTQLRWTGTSERSNGGVQTWRIEGRRRP